MHFLVDNYYRDGLLGLFYVIRLMNQLKIYAKRLLD